MQGTLQEWVYRQLREAIMTGQFIPGRSVTLRGVATMLDVSPMPVREAVRRLVAERALEAMDNRRVAVPRMTQDKLDELCRARIALEIAAAERALPAIDEKRLQRLRQLDTEINEAVGSGDDEAYLIKHRAFHFGIYDAAPSQVLLPLIESVWLQLGPFMRMVLRHLNSYEVDRHVEILDAIARRDARALSFAVEADIREGMGGLRAEVE
jgi:DNA-binding GntR family transcriptional regulator